MKRKYSRTFKLNALSVALAGLAAVLTYGYVQSGTQTTWTHCTVDVRVQKVTIAGVKKRSSKRLICNHDKVIIAIKEDHELPLTRDEFLEPNSVLSCSYDVARNPYRLFTDQVVTDSVECAPYNDTG